MHGSQAADSQKTAIPTDHADASLKQGSQGDAVQQLQAQLRKIGYHDMDRALHADGDFGDRTRRAVEAFQYDYGLTVDGVVGCKTSTALKHAEYAQRFFCATTAGSKKTNDTGRSSDKNRGKQT